MRRPNYRLVAGIYDQLDGEGVAQRGYAAFLDEFSIVMSEDDVAIIKEIMADEANHSVRLLAMAKKYSANTISADGLEDALQELLRSPQIE